MKDINQLLIAARPRMRIKSARILLIKFLLAGGLEFKKLSNSADVGRVKSNPKQLMMKV